MIAISKEEAEYLRGRFGDRVYITKPTKHGKRYCCEADFVKRALNEYHKTRFRLPDEDTPRKNNRYRNQRGRRH